jgi:hypothetical protein
MSRCRSRINNRFVWSGGLHEHINSINLVILAVYLYIVRSFRSRPFPFIRLFTTRCQSPANIRQMICRLNDQVAQTLSGLLPAETTHLQRLIGWTGARAVQPNADQRFNLSSCRTVHRFAKQLKSHACPRFDKSVSIMSLNGVTRQS